MPEVVIAGRRIAANEPPYVIAELSANHNGSIETALRIIEIAHERGADAVKIQTYTADTLTVDSNRPEFQITEGLWAGKSLYELYQWAHTPWDWHPELFQHARKVGITLFSSPFDSTAVDLLEDLNAPAYKIASFEAVDLPLIRYAAGTGKPMIISTGMADVDEIGEAVETARDSGCTDLALLHCVSSYPAPPDQYNLRTLADMEKRFDVVVGLSDHTLSNTTAVTSVALGSALIEKHVTLDRNAGGPDDSFSLEPDDLEQLVTNSRTAWEALGKVDYGRQSSEQGNVIFRRSLYFVRDLSEGAEIGPDDVRSIRPGYGAAPKHFESILGRRVNRDIVAPTPVRLEDLQE